VTAFLTVLDNGDDPDDLLELEARQACLLAHLIRNGCASATDVDDFVVAAFHLVKAGILSRMRRAERKDADPVIVKRSNDWKAEMRRLTYRPTDKAAVALIGQSPVVDAMVSAVMAAAWVATEPKTGFTVKKPTKDGPVDVWAGDSFNVRQRRFPRASRVSAFFNPPPLAPLEAMDVHEDEVEGWSFLDWFYGEVQRQYRLDAFDKDDAPEPYDPETPPTVVPISTVLREGGKTFEDGRTENSNARNFDLAGEPDQGRPGNDTCAIQFANPQVAAVLTDAWLRVRLGGSLDDAAMTLLAAKMMDEPENEIAGRLRLPSRDAVAKRWERLKPRVLLAARPRSRAVRAEVRHPLEPALRPSTARARSRQRHSVTFDAGVIRPGD